MTTWHWSPLASESPSPSLLSYYYCMYPLPFRGSQVWFDHLLQNDLSPLETGWVGGETMVILKLEICSWEWCSNGLKKSLIKQISQPSPKVPMETPFLTNLFFHLLHKKTTVTKFSTTCSMLSRRCHLTWLPPIMHHIDLVAYCVAVDLLSALPPSLALSRLNSHAL